MRTRFLLSVGLSDLLALAIASALASLIVFDTPLLWEAGTPGSIWPLIGFLGASMVVSSVVTDRMSGPGVPRVSYGRMVAIIAGTVFLTAGLIVLFRDVYWSRSFLAYTSIIWLPLATSHRVARTARPWTEQIAVITNEKQLADDLNDSEHAEVVWVLDPSFEGSINLPDREVTVAVDLRAVLSDRVARYLSSCDVAGYTVRPLTSIYEDHTGRVPLVHVAEGWEISAPLLEVARWLPGKRLFDLVATAATIPIWFTIGMLVAAYVKLTDPGKAVFSQRRVGLAGREFTMYKFRTMDPNAEADGPRFAAEDDPRLIRGARFLRRARLDEIPQLWNVLKGDMSLVGPRAEQVAFAEVFRTQIPFYDHRHLVRPGVTGWAQVSYGYADDEADTIEKLSYDLFYIKHMSPVMDIRIFWKSLKTILTGFGAR